MDDFFVEGNSSRNLIVNKSYPEESSKKCAELFQSPTASDREENPEAPFAYKFASSSELKKSHQNEENFDTTPKDIVNSTLQDSFYKRHTEYLDSCTNKSKKKLFFEDPDHSKQDLNNIDTLLIRSKNIEPEKSPPFESNLDFQALVHNNVKNDSINIIGEHSLSNYQTSFNIESIKCSMQSSICEVEELIRKVFKFFVFL
jgi:hypothetical protein